MVIPFVGAQTSSGPFGVFEIDGGAGDYHDYSLVYDPIAGSADLFVDGIERISDYTGTPIAFSRVAWGAGADNGTGEANFQSVTFETDSVAVSEPGALIVFAAGLAGLGVLRRRARRFP